MPKEFRSHSSERYRNVRAGKRRHEAAVERTRELITDRQIFDLKQQGYTDARIAEQLGLTPHWVNTRLNEIMRTYRVGLTGEVEARAGEMIAKYEYIANEALDAWRSSKNPRQSVSKTVSRKIAAQVVDPTTGEITTMHEEGGFESLTSGSSLPGPDVRYLETAMKAMGRLEKLLRVDEPQQIQVSVSAPDGGPVRFVHDVNYDDMEGEKLALYLRGLADAALTVAQPMIIEHEPDPAPDDNQAPPGGA